jgi:hypothetical protein
VAPVSGLQSTAGQNGAAKLPNYFDLDFNKNTGVQRLLQVAKGAAIIPREVIGHRCGDGSERILKPHLVRTVG